MALGFTRTDLGTFFDVRIDLAPIYDCSTSGTFIERGVCNDKNDLKCFFFCFKKKMCRNAIHNTNTHLKLFQ